MSEGVKITKVGNHPNLYPVPIRNKDELMVLASEMKRVALWQPCVEPHHYSDDMQDLLKIIRTCPDENFRYSRHVILFGKYYITLSCTFDKDEGSGLWRLSMAEVIRTREGVYSVRISDHIAGFVVKAILEKGYSEVENPSKTLPHLRMFIKEAQ
jgi:hypothetical protein